ncbi:MAG: helix-turn-helix domain-containing protein [Clostridia bacterium]|nr:helix-turn-helix domain-containing protein [Clostridia bacterium]
MYVTVGELLDAGHLPGACLYAGATGVERQVKSVLAGKIASDLAVRDSLIVLPANEINEGSVFAAADAQAAGILVHTDPEALALKGKRVLEMADSQSLPVILLPEAITDCNVVAALMAENNRRLLALVDCIVRLHGQFVEQASITGADFAVVAGILADQIRRAVAVVGRSEEVLGLAAHDPSVAQEFSQIMSMFQSASRVRDERLSIEVNGHPGQTLETSILSVPMDGRGRETVLFLPVRASGQVYGGIVVWPGDARVSAADAVALNIAVAVGSLEILRDRAAMEIDRSEKHHFIDDLLAGIFDTKAALVRRASSLGWNLDGDFSVITIEVSPLGQRSSLMDDEATSKAWRTEHQDKAVAVVRQVAREVGADVVAVARRDDVVVLMRQPSSTSSKAVKERTLRLAHGITSALNSKGGDAQAVVGVGQFYPDLARLGVSYQEAKKAIALVGSILPGTSVAHFDDLGVYRVISKCGDRSELDKFVREKLGTLIDYDRKHGSQLIETLRMYFDNGSSPGQTAKRLYVHVNTVKHRIMRISEITGMDFGSTDDQLVAYVALKILDYLRA